MFKPQSKQQITMDGIKLKPSNMCKSRSIITASSFVFSSIASHFPQLLNRDTDIIVSYCVCSTLLATLLYLASYKQWSIRLLKVLHKDCNVDVLRVLLIPYIRTLPRALCALRIVCIHQSNPSLLCCNLLMYIIMYVHTYIYGYVCVAVHKFKPCNCV